jgi:hypothetical protein
MSKTVEEWTGDYERRYRLAFDASWAAANKADPHGNAEMITNIAHQAASYATHGLLDVLVTETTVRNWPKHRDAQFEEQARGEANERGDNVQPWPREVQS